MEKTGIQDELVELFAQVACPEESLQAQSCGQGKLYAMESSLINGP